MDVTQTATFRSFAEFYRRYLDDHSTPACRRLHFFGILGALFCLAKLATTFNPWWLLAAVVWGYGLAWAGHFAFEKNRPPSFRHPLYSLAGDFTMFRDILYGRIPF